MRALHQMVPSLRVGDAVGGHTLRVRQVLRDLGLESEIFVENAHPALAAQVRHVDDYAEHAGRAGADRVAVIYQMAVGSNTADVFFSRPETKIVDYHNITPPAFFSGWDDFEAMRTTVGRTQMERLSRRVGLALADSAFNASDLADHGYVCPTEVVPILVDLDGFRAGADESLGRRLASAKRRGGSDLLFVGRMVPNKAQHQLIKTLAVYRRVVDPRARLHLVGSEGPERYVAALRRYAAELGLTDAVTFATAVSQAELTAYYQAADVLVCVSEHEGFCIPLLEAMFHDVPVVAFNAAAVPETLGDAGVLLDENDPLTVAVAVEQVLTRPGLRDRLVDAGHRRLAHFSLERSRSRLVDALAPVLGQAR